MKAYIFSIGEPTTNLCVELMQSYGFQVFLYQDDTSLWDKLKRFYTEALESDGNYFMRIDADIIPNANVKKLQHNLSLWTCASGFDWYKQDRGAISIHVMNRSIIEKCLEHVEEAQDKIRPETYLWRLTEVNPFTSVEDKYSCGIHGYGQKMHRDRIKTLKYNRNQEYDWNLIDKIEAL
jgi:hypothetical protein